MTSSAILRQLRQLAGLPLRRETVCHLLFNSEAIQSSVNRLIAADPALALGVLRLTPAAMSDQHLGIPQIARVATPAALLDIAKTNWAADDAGACQTKPIQDRIWTHALATAHAARQLSRSRNYSHPNTAFLAGLLHNLGLLACASVDPDLVEEVLDNAEQAEQMLVIEQERLGATHTSIGRQLATRWNLPHWLHDVIWWHHQPEDGLPADVFDRQLVSVVREADLLASRCGFGLFRSGNSQGPGLPWKVDDSLTAALLREVRQATAFMTNHPLREDSAGQPDRLAHRILELASENAALHATTDWRMAAWDRFASQPPDATTAELTGPVAETFAAATGALGVLCYVLNDDGRTAEGTLWSDDARPVNCPLLVSGEGQPQPPAVQIVARLRPVWQKRDYRAIDVGCNGKTIAQVLMWLDDCGPQPDDKLLQEVSALCGLSLQRAAQTSRQEQQLEQLAAALRDQSAQAEVKIEASKLAALAEMAAGAGHEINNPLAVISGRSQLLLAEESDPRRRKALETIISQAQRIHRMIVDLMTFARPPAPICQPLTIAELVEQAVARIKADAESHRITIATSVSPVLPQISGDSGQLCTVLECILQNSLEAIVEDGSIELAAESGPGGTVELRVSDNGPGISEEQRAHIFEPFYSGREAGRGLGMGLSKAWRFVQNHKGEIQIDSGPQGTTVIVRLPALAQSGEQRACA